MRIQSTTRLAVHSRFPIFTNAKRFNEQLMNIAIVPEELKCTGLADYVLRIENNVGVEK